MGYDDRALVEQELAAALFQEQFRLPDQSLNRGRFSRPFDVLFPDHFDSGVLAFPAGSASQQISSEAKKQKDIHVFKLFPEHVPLDTNYAHSEIRVMRDEKRLGHNKNVARTVELKYFGILAKVARVQKSPTRLEFWAKMKLRSVRPAD